MRRLGLYFVVAAALVLGLPASAGAHPLGNFSTNQLVELRFEEGGAQLHYVLDQAEIPSFQHVQRFDADGDGRLTGAEVDPLAEDLMAEAQSGIAVTTGGREVELGQPRAADVSFPAGQAGLRLTRLEADFDLALPPGAGPVEVTNEAFGERIGWRAILAVPGSGTAVQSSTPVDDPTGGLRDYPAALLESPLDQREATFDVAPGDGTVTGPDGAAAASGGGSEAAGDGFAATLTSSNTHGLLIVVLLATAFGWGALHALSPGHGKAMVAGYLAGSRGKPRHAVALGLTVTATHTASVFALGLITLLASEYVLPERLYPWLGVASGLLVVGVGLTVMRSRYRRWRSARAGVEAGAGHHHHHHHHHHHDHDHDHSHDHDHRAPIRVRELLGLGVSGGLVPCPSALVVLIAAISQHRVGLGMGLIFAFSLGLAATVTAVGLMTIWGGRLMSRLRPEQRLFGGRLSGALPAVSASAIVLVGVLITYRAMPELG
jgi:ABC-type nickel/cobalt efflux system permease component RcnA